MKLSRAILLRFQYLRFLLIGIGVVFFLWSRLQGKNFWAAWAWIPFLGFFLNGFVFCLCKDRKASHWCLWAELLGDAFLVSLLVLASGGRASPFVFLYPLLIFVGSLHVGKRGADVLTLLTLFGYLLIFWWPPAPAFSSETLWQFFIPVGAMGISGLLALRFAEEIRRRERQAEETKAALYRVEEIYQHIMRSMASGLVITDLDGVITSSNQKAREILKSSLKGQKLTEILSGLDLSKAQPRGEILLDRGKVHLGYSLFPLKDEKDRVFGYGLLFQDITHIKEQEERLRQAEHQAALGTMAAGLVHEIKNPLASIFGAIQLLRENQLVAPQGERLLSILERSCARLDELVTNFLFFAKPGGGEKKEISLKALCEELLEELSCDPALARVEVILNIPEVKLKIEPGRFKQVLVNLLLNAAQALKEQSSPRIELSYEGGQGDFWVLTVKDNGPGISKDVMPRIFEPFFTTKAHGTGLGLAVVYSLIQAWGGQVEVKSHPQEGTIFRLVLPRNLLA